MNHTYDNVIGKYYAQYRFYYPVNKRFMSSDPIKDGDNWYVYVLNNPETFVDALGLMSVHDAQTITNEMYKDYIIKQLQGVQSYIDEIL